MKILNDTACILDLIEFIIGFRFIWNEFKLKSNSIQFKLRYNWNEFKLRSNWIQFKLRSNWIDFKFNWKEMGCELVEEVLNMAHWKVFKIF